MKDRYVIIMAGGIGSRFWPLSRPARPKQFLDILGTGKTLIQETFNRFRKVCPAENIIVVTNDEHRSLVMEQLDINAERILSEPMRKNTAPCIAYGTFKIMKENRNAVIAVTPADHLISEQEVFEDIINAGYDFVTSDDSILTVGIKPDKPDTGYGYIQAGSRMKMQNLNALYRVKSFREKPDPELARSFVASGDFFWNSGIFLWKGNTIINAFDDFLADISYPFHDNIALLGTSYETDFIRKAYSSFKSISIDYGILEKASNVFVLPADMGWSDLGTWSSLYCRSKPGRNRNSEVRGSAFTFECSGNLISVTPGKIVLLQGLDDYMVVETEDALLIMKKKDEQKLKEYLREINMNGIN